MKRDHIALLVPMFPAFDSKDKNTSGPETHASDLRLHSLSRY